MWPPVYPIEWMALITIGLTCTAGTAGFRWLPFIQKWLRRKDRRRTPAIREPWLRSSVNKCSARLSSAAASIMPSQKEIFQTSLISEALATVAGVIGHCTQGV